MVDKVTVRKKGKIWVIHVNGKKYTADEFSESIGRNPCGVRGHLSSCDSFSECAETIKDMLWKIRNNIRPEYSVYRRKEERISTLCVKEEAEFVPYSVLNRYLAKWEKGEIDTDDLYKLSVLYSEPSVKGKRRSTMDNDKWQGLSGEEEIEKREKKLKSIPGPTPLERKLFGIL